MKHEPAKTDKKTQARNFDQISTYAWILSALLAGTLLSGCYAERIGQVTDPYALHPPPQYITDIFARQPDHILRMDAVAPGSSYRFDPSEKDQHFAADHQALRFRKVEMSVCSRMPQGTVLVDVSFVDGKGRNSVEPTKAKQPDGHCIAGMDHQHMMQHIRRLE